MNLREAINFCIKKLNFEDIRENQRKVVEAYLSGRDVLMISPTGSGKSLTFHIAPFAIDFFKHGERDDIQTVCLVIFPLVSLMNDQVSSLEGKYNVKKVDEVHCVAKWLVFYSFHLYNVIKLSVILVFVQLRFFCLKFALADISR